VEALRKAARGLLLPSEADAPLKPFLWEGAGGKLSKDRVRELAGAGEDAPVEETTLDDLFQAVPDEDRPQFEQLAEAIRQQLSGVKVYKVGDEAERDVYVVGKTSDGQWAGLKTRVVET
jgi:histidine triad (HIT) family protein